MDHVASSHRKELATKLIDQSSHNDQSFSKSGYQLQQQANHHEMSLSYFDGGGSTNNHQYQLPVRNAINNDASPIVNLTNTLEYLNFSNSYATTSSTNTTANSSNSVATGNVAANSMNSYYEDQNKNFYNSQPPQNAGPSALDQAGANYNYQNCLKNNWQYSANSDYNHYYSNYNGSYYDTQHHLQLQQQQPQHQQHLAQGGASDRVSFYQAHQQDHYVQPEPCYNYDARPAAYSDCNYVSDTGTDQSRSTSYQLDTARTSGIATKPNDHAVSSSAWAPNSSFQTTKVAVNQLSGTAETEPIHKQTTNKAKTGPAIKPGESQQLNMGSSKRVKAKSIPNDDKLSSSSGAKSTSYDSNQQQQQRTNQCHVCGRLYARPSTLKTHLRTHTNERPFKCNVCSKTFSQAANLTAHQRVHTGKFLNRLHSSLARSMAPN